MEKSTVKFNILIQHFFNQLKPHTCRCVSCSSLITARMAHESRFANLINGNKTAWISVISVELLDFGDKLVEGCWSKAVTLATYLLATACKDHMSSCTESRLACRTCSTCRTFSICMPHAVTKFTMPKSPQAAP